MTDSRCADGVPGERAARLGLLARSAVADLAAALGRAGALPAFDWLRPPQTGLVMVQARIGGSGARFNLGEASVTRCALRLHDGPVGIGTVRGTSAQHCERVALCDAMLQDARYHDRLVEQVLWPLKAAEDHARRARAARMATSKVEFFTLVRGE